MVGYLFYVLLVLTGFVLGITFFAWCLYLDGIEKPQYERIARVVAAESKRLIEEDRSVLYWGS
jgi:hypothetical protein